jgi:hypothetical protein
MATKSSWLSRDQSAQADFARDVSALKAFVGDGDQFGLSGVIDAFAAATSRFGSCELSIRRAERLAVVGASPEEAKLLTERALRENDRGLAAIAAVQGFVDGLGKVPIDDQARKRWSAESKDIQDHWTEQLTQLDVGASDARHLLKMTQDAFGAINDGGPAGLGEYLAGHLAELDKVRRTPERGTWTNSFPWWKIVAAAIWLGITAFAVWRAVTFGAAWWDVAMIIFIALIGTILIALGC